MTSAEGMATTIGDTVIDMSNDALKGAPKPKRGGGRPDGGGYYLADGTRVPSVTTVLSKFKDPGPLMHWATKVSLEQGFNHGRHGIKPPGLYAGNLAEIGSVVHDAAESFVHGADAEPAFLAALDTDRGKTLSEEQIAKASRSFASFLKWWRMVQPEIVATEIALVSESLRYGGTLDVLGRIDGKLCVIDYKTGKRVYDDAKIQVASYSHLVEEHYGERPSEFHVARFGKGGGFTHEMVEDVERWFRAFRCLRDAYEWIYEQAA